MQNEKKKCLSIKRKHRKVRPERRIIKEIKGFRAKYRIEETGIEGAHSINWCKFLCTIMSCTLFMVLSSRLVSVALVKWT